MELKRIHRDVGITMVDVTHDQTEAMTMSDRIAVFSHGTLEQVAPPLEVDYQPRTRLVGEFIGEGRGACTSPRPSRPPNQLVMQIAVIVNYGDSVLVMAPRAVSASGCASWARSRSDPRGRDSHRRLEATRRPYDLAVMTGGPTHHGAALEEQESSLK